MRKFLYVLAGVIGLAGASMSARASDGDADKPADPLCATDYKKCRSLKEVIDFYAPVKDARIDCIVVADNDLKYGAPEWPSIFTGPKFGSHVIEDKLWRKGTITLAQEGALIPNQFGGKERQTMFCEFDLNTQKVIDFYLK